MTRDELLQSLRPAGKNIVLKPSSPALGHLGSHLADAVNKQGKIVITSVKVQATHEGSLAVTGKAAILGASTEVRALFELEGGQLQRFCLLAVPPSTWRLGQCVPGSTALDNLHFDTPIFVITANKRVISDSVCGLSEEPFQNGLNLYAKGLKRALPAAKLGFDQLPKFDANTQNSPLLVKGAMAIRAKDPYVSLSFWWKPISGKMGQAKVLRVGMNLSTTLGKAAPKCPDITWLWDLQVHPDEQPFVMTAQMPAGSKEPPTYRVLFESSRFLKGGANSLNSLAGTPDLNKLLPFTKAPILNLASLEFSPNRHLAGSFVLLDSTSGEPYVWEAIPGLLTVRKATFSLFKGFRPSFGPRVEVSGIASIGDYDFDVDVTPGESVSGSLTSPEDIHLRPFVTKLFGQPIDLPDLDLELLAADYSYETPTKTAHYNIAVGGHIDVLNNGSLLLTEVGFEYESVAGKATYRKLTGGISIAKTSILITAEYQDGDGWDLKGEANPYKGIELNELADDLLHRWDAALPSNLPKVTLTCFSLQVGLRTKSFDAVARTRWTPPDDIPWFSGEIEAIASLSAKKNPHTGKREFHGELEWNYTHGVESFLASAHWDPNGKGFYVSWDGGKTKTLGLGTLHDALKLNKIFSLPEGGAWKVFDFNRLVVGYESNPRHIQLCAESKLAGGTLDIEAALAPGNRRFEAAWTEDKPGAEVGIDDILSAVGLDTKLELPGSIGKDVFSFDKLLLRYEADPDPSLLFLCDSKHAFYKAAFVNVEKHAGSWGFVAGASFKKKTKLTDIPGIGKVPGIGEAEKAVKIEPVYLMVSTLEGVTFAPPIYSAELGARFGSAPYRKQFGTMSSLAGRNPFGKGSQKLHKGATFAARFDFQNSGNTTVKNVCKVTGLKELDGKVSIGPNNLELKGIIPGTLQFPTGTGDHLTFDDPYLALEFPESGAATVRLGGSLDTHLFGHNRHYDCMLIASEDAIDASVKVTGGPPLPPPAALPGVRFKDDYSLEIGIQYEPEGLDLGFMSGFYVGDDPKKYCGDAIFVLEMIEEVPNPLYICFSVDQWDMWAAFESMTGLMAAADKAEEVAKLGDTGAGHDAESALEFLKHQYKNLQPIFEKISFHDVSFHWADSLVILPDGNTATPGVGFRGWIDFLGLKAFAKLDASIGASTHLSGLFEMDSIGLQDVLTVSGDGKGVRMREAKGGKEGWDHWKKTGAKPGEETGGDGAAYLIQPGGPVLALSSQHSPFFHANLHVALFDIINVDLEADITDHGFAFELSCGAGKVAHMELDCSLRVENGFRFESSGSASIHLHGDIGPIIPGVSASEFHVNADLDASIDLIISDKEFKLTVEGSFEFEGAELDIPRLTIDVPFGELGDLAEKVWDHVVDNAEEIFADFLDGLWGLAKKAYKKAKEIAKKGLHEAEKIGKEAFEEGKKLGQEAAAAVGKEAKQVAEEAKQIGAGAKAAAEAAKKEAEQIGKDAAQAAEDMKNAGERALKGAAEEAKQIGEAASQALDAIGGEIAGIAEGAAHEALEIAGRAAKEAQEMLDSAKQSAEAIGKEAERLAGPVLKAAKRIGEEAKQIWNWVKEKAEQAKQSLENAGKAVGHFFGIG